MILLETSSTCAIYFLRLSNFLVSHKEDNLYSLFGGSSLLRNCYKLHDVISPPFWSVFAPSSRLVSSIGNDSKWVNIVKPIHMLLNNSDRRSQALYLKNKIKLVSLQMFQRGIS